MDIGDSFPAEFEEEDIEYLINNELDLDNIILDETTIIS